MSDRRPSPTEALGNVIRRTRTRGPIEVLSLALERLRNGIWSEDSLTFLTRATGEDPEGGQDVTFRRAEPSDAELYARTIGTESASTFRRRLTDTTSCWLVVDGETLLHASWTTTAAAWTRELARYFVPPPGDAYIYESFTAPQTRGRGLYPFALRSLAEVLGKEGVERLWVGVESANVPSQRAIAKAGFSPAFDVRFARRFFRVSVDGSGTSGTGVRLERTL